MKAQPIPQDMAALLDVCPEAFDALLAAAEALDIDMHVTRRGLVLHATSADWFRLHLLMQGQLPGGRPIAAA